MLKSLSFVLKTKKYSWKTFRYPPWLNAIARLCQGSSSNTTTKIIELEKGGGGYCNNICKRFYTTELLGRLKIFYIWRLNGSTDIFRRLDNIGISKFENGRVRKGLSVTTRTGVISVLITVVITEILSTSLRRPSHKIAEVLRPETPSISASYSSFYGVSNSTERYATQGEFVSV